MMRFLISILLVVLFSNAQAFTGICASLCVHNKSPHNNHSQINHQVSDHACCHTEEKEQSHDCSSEHCMISMPSDEIPLLIAKPEIKKNPETSDLTVGTGTQFLVTNLLNKTLLLNLSNPDSLTLKVPLYIYYQKFLE